MCPILPPALQNCLQYQFWLQYCTLLLCCTPQYLPIKVCSPHVQIHLSLCLNASWVLQNFTANHALNHARNQVNLSYSKAKDSKITMRSCPSPLCLSPSPFSCTLNYNCCCAVGMVSQLPYQWISKIAHWHSTERLPKHKGCHLYVGYPWMPLFYAIRKGNSQKDLYVNHITPPNYLWIIEGLAQGTQHSLYSRRPLNTASCDSFIRAQLLAILRSQNGYHRNVCIGDFCTLARWANPEYQVSTYLPMSLGLVMILVNHLLFLSLSL